MMSSPLLRLLPLLTCLALVACHRHPAPGITPQPAASPTPSGPSASATPVTSPRSSLPNFAVQPVRTEEGTAEWYDVPDDSLAARRAWPEEMTAASDTLPQNTYVRVTPLAPEKGSGDGKPVVVRVTDNGVHKKGVLIDVDRDAARTLGIVKAGEARVRIEILALQNATVDKPVDQKDAPVASKASDLTGTPTASEQSEKDAAQAKADGTQP